MYIYIKIQKCFAVQTVSNRSNFGACKIVAYIY